MKQHLQAYYHNWFAVTDLYEQFAKRYGLSSSALFLLQELQRSPCTQRALCAALVLPKQTVHSILKNFEAKQYISLTASETDKRERIVSLTEIGQQFCGAMLERLSSIEQQAMGRMSALERDAMTNANRRFAQCLQEAMHTERKEIL